LPLAALGVFVLLKKEFRVSGIAALLAGLCWGFGVRMAAEQNHPMQIIQLALLPWETLLLVHSWRSWRYAIGLGLLFGVSFFAGQPQTFFFIGIFFGCFTLAETCTRWRRSENVILPFFHFAIAMILALGISAIQLLPTLQLVGLSARSHMDFDKASFGAIHVGHWINFFVPKFYGEYPGFNIPKSGVVIEHFWYWEATFYWGALAEILALFAIVQRWKHRIEGETASRYIFFFTLFSLLAVAYGMGKNLYFQWPFWKFIPFFDHIRAPNRMIWLTWFIGTLLTGVGLDDLRKDPSIVARHARYFFIASGLFVCANVVAALGAFDLLFSPHTPRHGLFALLLPSLLASLLTMLFIYIGSGKTIVPVSRTVMIAAAALLISGELLYNDFTWHRNQVNPEAVVASDSNSKPLRQFRNLHNADHAKLLLLYDEQERKMRENLGMFLRLPLEPGGDPNELLNVNPLRVERAFPPINDTARRLEISGVTETLYDDTLLRSYTHPLPFLKLYHTWRVASEHNDSVILNDTTFNFANEILLSESPSLPSGIKNVPDSAVLRKYGENQLQITVTASQPSILLVNDLYYPAWHATVDGKETKILRGFTSLRAVPVSAGMHTVEMYYDDSAFDLGWKITLGTLAISLFALFMGRKQKNPDQ
jgi:hypothetical protein